MVWAHSTNNSKPLQSRLSKGYQSKLEVTYLTDLTMPALLDRLRHLPSNTIVYHTAFTQDATGERFVDSTRASVDPPGAAECPRICRTTWI